MSELTRAPQTKTERFGAVDCGTNSIRLLISEYDHDSGQWSDLLRAMEIVRLGQGVDATGEFSADAIERTVAVLNSFKQELQKYEVLPGGHAQYQTERLRFVATSATRNARNRNQFTDHVRQILGVEPEVILGEEEAALSFIGATQGVAVFRSENEPAGHARSADPRTLVIDLGGGSTEFVLGQGGNIAAAISVEIGCVRLTERFAKTASVDVPEDDIDWDGVTSAVTQELDKVAEVIDFSQVQTAIGVAGTVTTVAAHALDATSYDPHLIHGTELTVDEIENAASDFRELDKAERAALPYLHPGRVDVIAVGSYILQLIAERVHQATEGAVGSLIASETDILDGIVRSLLIPR